MEGGHFINVVNLVADGERLIIRKKTDYFFPLFYFDNNIHELVRDSQAQITYQTSLSSGQCRNLRFINDPIHGYRLMNHVIRTTDVSNEDICQMQCYLEPNCVSYNFNKKEEENGKHKCDLNKATYEHDNEHSSSLTKNESYVYRGAEVNIQPVTLCELCGNAFCRDSFWQDLLALRQREVDSVPICHRWIAHEKTATFPLHSHFLTKLIFLIYYLFIISLF